MSDKSHEKTVFFHVGLGKTASKYLQYKVFPYFEGVYYIQRTKYKRFQKIIQNTDFDRYLVSNEFDRQFFREVDKINCYYSDAGIIILLRRHDSWIASQYRRFAKNGFYLPFQNFFDIENDHGAWKQSDLLFYPKLEFISKYFDRKPLVLFHEDLKNDPIAFIDRIANYVGATYDKSKISLKPRHTSYNEKQIKAMQAVSRFIFPIERKEIKNTFLRYLRRYWHMLIRYPILYFALILPSSWFSEKPLIPQDQLDKIREKYADDWQRCVEYAKKVNEV